MNQQPPLNLPIYKPASTRIPPSTSEIVSLGLEYCFLTCAILLFFQGMTPRWDKLINDLSINFLAIMLEALPFMLIGSLVSGLIEVFVPIAWIDRIFHQRKTMAVFLAGSMGLFFPVCECAIVPVVRRLLSKGIPLSAAITFLLAGPIVNVIVAASTAIAYRYDWTFVVVRLGIGYALAVFIGLLVGRFFNRENGLLPTWKTRTSCGCGHDHGNVTQALFIRLRHALEHASDDFFDVGRYLVIGAFITALMRSTLDMNTFLHLMDSPWLAILLMMAMAIILNLCSETDAFIAASFRGLLPDSAQMAFMVLGPMLDIKLILMYFSVFRKRTILFLILTVFTTVFLAMLGLQFSFPNLS
ncbi:MAG: permease [Desulfocapsaceae bacterium]|nr:permease [Desulfocapsaceae bacterium]